MPHPRLHERPFVPVPMMDIAPQWPHPIFGKTIAQLVDQLSMTTPITGVEQLD